MVTMARRWAVAIIAPALLFAAGPATAAVTDTTATVTDTPATQQRTRWQVVARNLENVRGLTVDAHGTLYAAEAGRGGNGPCIPANFGPELCFGSTGAVTVVRDGKQRRVVSGLPSLRGRAAQGEPASSYGPHDVAIAPNGALLVAMGYATAPEYRARLGSAGAALGTVVKVERSGRWAPVADLAAYEQEHNPHNEGLESQPYSIVRDGGGFVVADAAANDAIRVDRNGRLSTLAVFPSFLHEAPPEWGLPPGTKVPVQAVPVTVTRGPDGALYFGELTGAFFPEGTAKVWRKAPGQEPTVHATGFTNIIDIAFDARGRLIVLEIAKRGLDSGDLTGALIRVERDGARTELASEGLVAPTSVAVGKHGALYVANNGLSETAGEVLRLRPPQ